jgi:putative hydrolase of HD superfamily
MGDSFAFLSNICGILKDIKRTGWVRHNVPLPESDSDHMHRCAMCAMMVTAQDPDPRDDYSSESGNEKFHPSKIDAVKLLRMALTHDICESIAGDVTPFCDAGAIASKHDKEKAAMNEIRKVIGDPLGKELFELWLEYEEQVTPVALYCKDIDKFEMVMQAYEYEKKHLISRENTDRVEYQQDTDCREGTISEPLRTFFITTNSSLKSPIFRRLDDELRTKRQTMLKEKGWEVTKEERQQYPEAKHV